MADFHLKKSRSSDTTMDDIKDARKKGLTEDFKTVHDRGYAKLYPRNESGHRYVIDWRLNEAHRQKQRFVLRDIETGAESLMSRQELEAILRHV